MSTRAFVVCAHEKPTHRVRHVLRADAASLYAATAASSLINANVSRAELKGRNKCAPSPRIERRRCRCAYDIVRANPKSDTRRSDGRPPHEQHTFHRNHTDTSRQTHSHNTFVFTHQTRHATEIIKTVLFPSLSEDRRQFNTFSTHNRLKPDTRPMDPRAVHTSKIAITI